MHHLDLEFKFLPLLTLQICLASVNFDLHAVAAAVCLCGSAC